MSEESDLTLSNIPLDTRSFTVDLLYISGADTYIRGFRKECLYEVWGSVKRGRGLIARFICPATKLTHKSQAQIGSMDTLLRIIT